jgi:hypothetical protein
LCLSVIQAVAELSRASPKVVSMTRRKLAMKDASMDWRSALLKAASVLWGIPIAANLSRWLSIA